MALATSANSVTIWKLFMVLMNVILIPVINYFDAVVVVVAC